MILHQVHVFIEMKLPGTCSLLKESHKKRKNGTYFWGDTEWDLLFQKGKSRTPTF